MKHNDELWGEMEDAPLLKKMKEKPGEGFQVPKDYFKQLPDEVWKQVRPAATTAPTRPSWLERIDLFLQALVQPRYALALASVVVLVVASVVFLKDKNTAAVQQPALAQVQLEDISDEELFAYVSDNIGEFDHKMVVEVSEPADLPAVVHPKKPSLKTEAPKPAVEEMEEYLEEVIDEVDVEDLEELL